MQKGGAIKSFGVQEMWKTTGVNDQSEQKARSDMTLGWCKFNKCTGIIKSLNDKLSAEKSGVCDECGRKVQVVLI